MNNNFIDMVNEAYEILDNISNTTQIENDLILPKLITEISPAKLYWKNIVNYLNILNRSPDHFYIFLKNELCNNDINWYSENKEDGIIIHGKYLKNIVIIELIKKYINMYVICDSCKKKYTTLNKITTKKYEFKCLNCGMSKILY